MFIKIIVTILVLAIFGLGISDIVNEIKTARKMGFKFLPIRILLLVAIACVLAAGIYVIWFQTEW